MNATPAFAASRRSGFTLVELLIVMAVICVLVALLLPAIGQCRETARRMQCASNLTQLIIAVNHYQATHGVYPPGTIDAKGPVLNARLGYHHNWLVQSLPFLEQRNAYAAVDSRHSIYHVNNKPIRDLKFDQLFCPSDTNMVCSYAACHHDAESPIDVQNNGVFFLNSRLRPRDIKDGTANTVFLGEKITDAWDMEWTCGTRGTLRNTGSPINFLTTRNGGLPMGAWGGAPYDGTLAAPRPEDMLDVPGLESDNKPADPGSSVAGVDASKTGIAASRLKAPIGTPTYVGGFGSAHPSGANFAFGDGSLRFLNDQLSREVLQRLGHRADGQLPPEF